MRNFKGWWPEELALLTPPEDLTVSEVADKYRILGRGSAKPGRWETSFVPYMRDVMDSFGIDPIQEIFFIKPSQTGGTEAILNMLLYAAIQDPGPAMLIEPTENLADEISQERLDLMIQTTPELKGIQSPDSDPTKKKKVFISMTVYLAWSNSPTSLASRPIRFCLFDEIDKYRKFSGDEASPLSLGRERTHTFIFNRKLVYVSTPTTDVGYITRGEESCEARFRYRVPCPYCGKRQTLVFEQVKFSEFKDDLQKVEDQAHYECESCQGTIYNNQKAEMVRRGKWFDLVSGSEFSECIEKIRPKRIGFQINRLYSSWHTFGMVAREFLESKDYLERLMNWKNSWMAEPWVERYEVKTEAAMMDNVVEINPLVVPVGSVGLTCGIDPSEGGFWFVVLAWKSDMSPHLVRYGCLAAWDEVTSLVWESNYQIEGTENRAQIWRSALDTGGGEREDHDLTMTEQAYDWLRRYGRGKCFGVKGMSHPSMRKIKISTIDKMPQGQAIPGGITLLNLDTGSFKDAICYRLMIKEGEPGRFTFHRETGEDFLSHLLSEEKRVDRMGKTQWVQTKKKGHWLDACVYAYALADPEFQGGVRVLGPAGQTIRRRVVSVGVDDIYT